MNLTCCSPTKIEIKPMRFSNGASEPLTAFPLCTVCLQFGAQAKEALGWTYVPKNLQEFIARDEVAQVIRVILDMGGFASRLLPEQPQHVILAIVTKSGKQVLAVPKVFERARSILLGVGWSVLAIGLAFLFFSNSPITGALCLVAGSHAIRTVASVPSAGRVLQLLSWPKCNPAK